MHRLAFACVLGLLVLAPPSVVVASEGDAVEALLAPARPGEEVEPADEALQALLADSSHDAWLLVEHLLARGRQDLAVRLAGLTDEQVVGPLRSYAEAPDASSGAAERVAALAAAREARDAGEDEAALGHLERVRAVPGRASVFAVRAASLQGDLLLSAERRTEGIEAWLAGGEEALRIGWTAVADRLFGHAEGAALPALSLDLLARGAEGVRAVREVQGERETLANAVQDQGSIAHWRGDLSGALRHFDEALGLYESLDLGDDVAQVRSQRSWALAETGDFRAALDEQKVLARHFEGRPRDAAWATNQVNLGLIRYGLGNEEGALGALRLALETYRAVGDAGGEAYAQGNLAITYLMAGRWDDSIEASRAARAIAETTQDPINVAAANNNIATALRQRAEADLLAAARAPDLAHRAALEERAKGALAEGRTLVEAALGMAQEGGVAGMACVARHTLGEILLVEGRHEEALRLLEPVRAEARRLRAWRVHVALTVTLARAHLLAGDPEAALHEVRTATDALGAAFGRLADADLARARSLVSDVYDIGVSAASRTNSEEDLLHFLEAGRAAALLRGLGGRAAALRATVPRALVERLARTTRAKLEAFAQWSEHRRTGALRGTLELREAYDALRVQEQAVLEAIGQAQTAAAARLAPARLVAISDVQRRLRATARPGLRQVFALFNFQGEEATALLIEARGARVVRYPRQELGALRAAFATLSAARDGALDADALAAVRGLLIDPLGIPAGPTRLFVSPDRDLGYIPLSAILPDDWEVVWEPSATIYDLLAESRLRKGHGVLGLGDPDYRAAPDPDALTTRGGPRLVPLPGTRLEIEGITGASGDRRLLAERATERGLRAALESTRADRCWKSVHLACHGLVDVELPALSCLALTPGSGEDGFLTAGEVLRLPLRTDLAVLSACRTGRGRFVRGEGVMSLTRAFMYAGAARVIVSLWDVDDEATAFLMQAFYRHWKAGRGTAEALRLAQIAVRDHEIQTLAPGTTPANPGPKRTHRPWADPRYWAAWVHWGLPD